MVTQITLSLYRSLFPFLLKCLHRIQRGYHTSILTTYSHGAGAGGEDGAANT